MVAPSTTDSPLILNTCSVLTPERILTFKVTRYSLTAPLAAVTETTSVLGPSARLLRPAMATVASGSAEIASTVTWRVRAASSTTDSSATSNPFTLNELKLVLELKGATTTFSVISLLATWSAAVISISTTLLPTCSPVLPVMRTVAAASLVTATTFTDVVRAGSSIVWPSTTPKSFKVKLVSAVSAEAPPTRTMNSYESESPLGAVTVIVIVLSPNSRASAPSTTISAASSLAVT